MKKNKIIIFFLIIIAIFFVFFINSKTNDVNEKQISKIAENSNKIQVPEINTKTIKVFLEIEEEKYETEIFEKANIYELMKKLQSEEKIDFKTKNYSGMGEFVDEINGIKNAQKYWIYYVNGKKANIGISNYKINQNDIVSWKYEKEY